MNYNHFTINDRIVLAQLRNFGYSIRQISQILDRAPSSISREIKRNSLGVKGIKYIPSKAQSKYEHRKKKCGRRSNINTECAQYIKECIEKHWSPDQIYHRKMDLDIPSVSTIYRMIHRKQLGTINMVNIRRKGTFKRPAETRGRFNDGGRTIKSDLNCIQPQRNRTLGRRHG